MSICIRTETEKDFPAIRKLLIQAFNQPDEAQLVERIRNSSFYHPELTFILEFNHRLVGHLMLSTIFIDGDHHHTPALSLAPISILPPFQGLGFGGQLINHSIKEATKQQHESIILLGHAYYYPRFGFEPTSKWKVSPPFDVPEENFMAIELIPDALKGKSGTVHYPNVWELAK